MFEKLRDRMARSSASTKTFAADVDKATTEVTREVHERLREIADRIRDSWDRLGL